MSRYSTMLKRKMTVPMVSSPWKRKGTVRVSTSSSVAMYDLPLDRAFAMPPVAMVRVKKAHVTCLTRFFHDRIMGF
jgi:hypothetical protein